MNKVIITKYRGKYATCIFENGEMTEVSIEEPSENIIGNVYVGRVENVVKNMNAAFVEFQKGIKGYLPLEKEKDVIFLNRKNNDRVNMGDLILVQVERDAVKNKAAVLSPVIQLSGKYVVVSTAKGSVSVSNKITDKTLKAAFKEKLKDVAEKTSIIVRTNSADARMEDVYLEAVELTEKLQEILEYAPFRTAFTLMHQSEDYFTDVLKNIYTEGLDSIVTDDEEAYRCIMQYVKQYDKDRKVEFYQDKLLPLMKLYSIESRIEQALERRVWLKSGGYLIIDVTEAMVVIDVNTGKSVNTNKKKEDMIYKVNCEAAEEIAAQLRLRNYSGIILVDFIDMKQEEHIKGLLELLDSKLKKDHIPTNLIDMTSLGLVEITRKKVKRPLYEQCREL